MTEFIVDETLIKVGSEYIWLWVAIEPKNREILALKYIQRKKHAYSRTIHFDLVRIHGKHPVSTDGGTWYPQACRFLNLEHHVSFPFGEKPDRKDNAVHKGQD